MQFGLYIENTPRRGSQYFDSEKREYNYRYYTITITNDSIVPVRLKINFDKTSVGLFNVFLITRRLTPEEYSMTDQHLLLELLGCRKRNITKPIHLNKVLKPNEKCVFTFGVLSNVKDLDPTTPFSSGMVASKEKSLFLEINKFIKIPCGQFSFDRK